MNSRVVPTLAAVGLLGLSACGGGGGSLPNPTPGPTCGPSVTSQLVYPVPGATGVPDGITQIVIAVNPGLANNTFDLALSGSNGFSGLTSNQLVVIAASQVPPGSAAVKFANPTYMSVQISGLPAAQAVTTIGINNDTTDVTDCTPQTIPGATFTTQ